MPFKKIDNCKLEEINNDTKRINKSVSGQIIDTSLINKVEEKCNNIIKKCNNLHRYISSGDMESLEKNSSQLIKYSQDLTQMLRKIPINFGIKDSYSLIKTDINNDNKVKFKIEDQDILRIIFDDYFPRRQGSKICENLDYIRSSYAPAFEKFFLTRNLKYSGRVVIIYLSYFTDLSKVVDDDNFDTKTITDFISQYVLIDDNPTRCAKIYDYRIGKKNHSEIVVVPIEKINNVFQFMK